jgi:hypothetical protein
MRSTVKRFLVTGLLMLAGCHRAPDLTGEWTATDDGGDAGTFIFREDETLLIVRGAETYQFEYEIDASEKPMWFDLIVKRADGDTAHLPGIIEVLDENIVRYRGITEEGEARPTDFGGTGYGEQRGVLLRRVRKPEP